MNCTQMSRSRNQLQSATKNTILFVLDSNQTLTGVLDFATFKEFIHLQPNTKQWVWL